MNSLVCIKLTMPLQSSKLLGQGLWLGVLFGPKKRPLSSDRSLKLGRIKLYSEIFASITATTRRFANRPFFVSLLAMGRDSP